MKTGSPLSVIYITVDLHFSEPYFRGCTNTKYAHDEKKRNDELRAVVLATGRSNVDVQVSAIFSVFHPP